MSRETELRSELVKGNAYRSMYLSAVVGLVASSSPWVMALVPETLFLDRRRLFHMHTEFNCIVDRAAVLTMVVHLVIGNDRDPPLEKRTVGIGLFVVAYRLPFLIVYFSQALSTFSSFLVGDMSIEFDKVLVISELGKALDANGLFCGEERVNIYDVAMKGLEKDNAVRKLM